MDVTVCVGASSLRAHKAVLLARAPHILLGAHQDPNTIHLTGYDFTEMSDFIRYIGSAVIFVSPRCPFGFKRPTDTRL